MRRFGWFPVCLWCVVFTAALRAHDPGISTAEVQVYPTHIEITTGFAPDDAKHFLPPTQRTDERWDEDNFPDVRPGLLAAAPALWDVQEAGRSLPLTESDVQLLPGDNVSFRLRYTRGQPAGWISLRARKLGELPDGHRQFVIVADDRGSTLTKKLMRATDASLEVGGGATPSATSSGSAATAPSESETTSGTTFWGFLKLGVEHIWTGYDHLLFLFALLIVCRSFRSIVAIVSCFTLAHSITLALATLNLVNLPARWVEPAIAASIIFVGLENLVRRGEEPRGRWAVTFVFGLIHGFGFASVLRDLGVGRGGSEGIGMPLFSFNLGVELGQVVIAAAVLPLVWWLRQREAFVRRGVPALSITVAAAGTYWLLDRTVLA